MIRISKRKKYRNYKKNNITIIYSYNANEKNKANENNRHYINPSIKRNDRCMPKNYGNYELSDKNPNFYFLKLKMIQ